MEVTTHNYGNLRELVEEHSKKLNILKYYPYGPETTFKYWLTGTIDLRNVYKEPRNKGKTEKDYAYSIIEEVGRAMNYLSVHGTHPAYDYQRLNAFALHDLFHGGIMGWTKKPLKGLTDKEKQKLYELHQDRYDLVSYRGKYADAITKRYEKNILKGRTKEQIKEYFENEKKHKEHNRKKYGIYFVERLPLIPFSNHGGKWKSLYTKQELAAIDLMVSMAFENLC